jgi:hypothetical protein
MNDLHKRRVGPFVALLAAVFVGGVAVGVIGDRLMRRGTVIRTRVHADMPSVLDRLQLSPRQRAQAESILSRRTPGTEAVMLETAERLRRVSDSIDLELRQILTAEQRVRLDSFKAREPRLMLKRKVMTPSGTSVDSVFLPSDSTKGVRP